MIDAHRGAFEYEWRARFHLPLRVVGRSMSWGEALRLYRILASDPSTRIAAAVGGGDHPATRELLALLDLYDLQHTSKARKRPAPYPRPWGTKQRTTRGTARLTKTELVALLAAHRDPPDEE